MAQNRKLQDLVEPKYLKGGSIDRLTSGGIPIVYKLEFAVAGAGDAELVVDRPFTVIDAWVQLNDAGTAGDSITLLGGSDTIMTAIDISSGGNKDIVRAAELDDDHTLMTAGETLKATLAGGGDAPPCIVYVMGIIA